MECTHLARLAVFSAAIILAPPMLAAPAPILEVHAPAQLHLPPGGHGQIAIEVEVAPGFHVQANPPVKPNLIATELKVLPREGISFTKPVYPRGLPIAFGHDQLSVYSGTFVIELPVTAARALAPGAYPVRGSVRYQGCDEKTCFRPAAAAFDFELVITSPRKSSL